MGGIVQPRGGGAQQKEEHLASLRSALALYPSAVAQLVQRVGMEVLVSCFRTVNQASQDSSASVSLCSSICVCVREREMGGEGGVTGKSNLTPFLVALVFSH
jgi:hypothetical protein